MNSQTFLFSLAGVVILVLTGIAIYLHIQLYRQRQARAATEAKLAEAANAQRERINKSIQIIAQASLADDLSLTEASIRISVLLDSLEISDGAREEFSAFYQLREATAHIPILEAWKQLSRKEQNQFDVQRFKQESTYGDFVRDAARRIQGREF